MANNWITHVLKYAPVKESELLMLLILADAATPAGSCWMSKVTLAGLMRMDERSMPRIARKLQDKNCLKVIERKRWNGSSSSNGYQLLPMVNDVRVMVGDDSDVTGGGDTRDIPGVTPMTSLGMTHVSPLEPKQEPSTEPTQRPRSVVVVSPAPLSGEYEIVAEAAPTPTAAQEGQEPGTVEDGAAPIPRSAAPLTPSGAALVAEMCRTYPRYIRRPAAEGFINTYGEGRVADVWQYVKDNAATLRKPVGFMRSELRKPFYVPLEALAQGSADWPHDEAATESDEDTSTPDVWRADPSIETVIRGDLKAAAVWSLAASQLLGKGFREIRSAQDVPLAAYDAATQTYTVRVATAHLQQQLGNRYGKVVQHTLQGLHDGASVVFVTKDTPLAIPAGASMKGN